MTTTTVAVFAAQRVSEPDAGWGKLLAMLGVFGLFWLVSAMHGRYKRLHAADATAAATAGEVEGVNSRSGDPFDTGDPALGTVEKGWGAVDYPDGQHRVALAPVPAAPPQAVGTVVPIRKPAAVKPKLDDVVAAELADNKRPVDVIRTMRRRFGKSEATVKRAIRRVREGGAA